NQFPRHLFQRSRRHKEVKTDRLQPRLIDDDVLAQLFVVSRYSSEWLNRRFEAQLQPLQDRSRLRTLDTQQSVFGRDPDSLNIIRNNVMLQPFCHLSPKARLKV